MEEEEEEEEGLFKADAVNEGETARRGEGRAIVWEGGRERLY